MRICCAGVVNVDAPARLVGVPCRCSFQLVPTLGTAAQNDVSSELRRDAYSLLSLSLNDYVPQPSAKYTIRSP